MLGLRLGDNPRVLVTTTPRQTKLMKQVERLADKGGAVTRGRTVDNPHLPASFIAAMIAEYGGTRKGRQELDGELIDDVEGALWTRAMLEGCRVLPGTGRWQAEGLTEGALLACDAPGESPLHQPAAGPPPRAGEDWVRVVVGVDPPAGSVRGDGDACGIVVAALDGDGIGHVLADASVRAASPEGWARAVARAADTWGADRVIAEANNGGKMVASVLRAADVRLPVRLVHAAHGKVARAEPVAALYEAGRVRHRGMFRALEDEMCGLIAGGGYEGPGRSPDRADALVWALSELMLGKRRGAAAVRGL
jgi:phage terminase large subunit-like protein